MREFGAPYRDEHLAQIASPMGGMGAGMICLEGTGALTKFSLCHRPDLRTEPRVFAAVSIAGSPRVARVLEGPVPKWAMEHDLFNGEFFFQKTEWQTLRTPFPPPADDVLAGVLRRYPAMLDIARVEGPPYQYGRGCLSEALMGAWLSWACGFGEILHRSKIESHVLAAYRHNFKENLAGHAVPSRAYVASFGSAEEGGLLVCSWPHGGRPSFPMLFVDQVWTGVEHLLAAHLIALGRLDEGLRIVRTCRERYDGRVRNPFDEIELGHWYVRALSSYTLLQAVSGARYDAVEKILHLLPAIQGDFRCFLSTATGCGTVGVRKGGPFVEVVAGEIPYRRVEYCAPA